MSKSTINTIIGIALIFGVFIVYYLVTKPSKEDIEKARKWRDSAIKAQIRQYKEDSVLQIKKKSVNDSVDSIKKIVISDTTRKGDSIRKAESKEQNGIFSKSSAGNKKSILLVNDLVKLRISPRGGFVSSVQLRKYHTYHKDSLILFNNDTALSMNFFVDNIPYKTSRLFFEPFCEDKRFAGKDSIVISGSDSVVFCMRLHADLKDSIIDPDRYIEFRYVLKGDSYMIGFSISFEKMKEVLAGNSNSMFLEWNLDLRQQEKSRDPEKNTSTVYYKLSEGDVDYLSETKDDKTENKLSVKWISFKQQFFSSTIIAGNAFKETDLAVTTHKDSINPHYLESMSAAFSIPFDQNQVKSFPMHLYFGPNQYKTLRSFDLGLERQIPLGWGFFLLQWINRFAVIPIFNWLESYGVNYGIIILILTILLKIVLFPIAYKTYKSSAKMRVLKPEVEEINKKFPKKEDAMKKQQATMALYKKAGVNPMSGCIPLLLQMPILIAMYRFFPASIELRQQPFLWADDLSTYDSVANLGFNIPMYGDHVSLFTLLMTISTVIYTWLNNQMMGSTNQMPGMKWMMYLMPILFLGFFNNFAAGLSYYYLLANLITFLQMYLFRRFIDEDKIHAQIQENKKKPVKKSSFQARLEEMARKRGYNPPKR